MLAFLCSPIALWFEQSRKALPRPRSNVPRQPLIGSIQLFTGLLQLGGSIITALQRPLPVWQQGALLQVYSIRLGSSDPSVELRVAPHVIFLSHVRSALVAILEKGV